MTVEEEFSVWEEKKTQDGVRTAEEEEEAMLDVKVEVKR